jgi:ribonucleoside-diphosphate reductase alpha chain
MSNKGKQFLSDLKLYSDYLKFDEEKGRYETWEEACDKVFNTHRMKYGSIVDPLIEEVKQSYYDKEFLASQRNLQFREELILKNNCKLYNCCVSYAYSPDVFSKGFFILLSGTGLGISLKNKFVNQLPSIDARTNGTKTYVVDDSIEGWADAARVLISSYCKHPSLDEEYYDCKIRFDLSNIRPKGAYITGGFKAPGPEGLKQSLERIEALLDGYLGDEESKPFKSIIAYDIFMHLSDAVLSGGVRRSAMNVIIDKDDEDMINAKTGNWRQTHPWRARSNNSVGLIRGEFTKAEFEALVALNEGDNDIGFVFMGHEDEMFNPCFEIGFNFYEMILDRTQAVFQFCNLDEISASACSTSTGRFDEEKFYKLCRTAAIVGTLQAGYTDFPYLGKQTEYIVSEEALLGVSITGWMGRPELFDPEILKKGAEIVKTTNEEVAKIIGIKTAARTTTTKPSGNASVVLQTPSGIHPEHSERYFRIMQLNKDSETAKWLEESKPEMLEESAWSSTNSDYVVYVPCINPEGTLYKNEMQGVKHLKLIELAQNHWVRNGKREDRCFNPKTEHNISNTVLIDDKEEIVDYIFENQENFTAVSFLSLFGDKDYNQAPFTSVLDTEGLFERYGRGVLFMSGLIVDGLHYFNGDLWEATTHILNKDLEFTGDRTQALLKKDWVSRAKRFAKNYFKNDLNEMVYCMKDVHLCHKWDKISRGFKLIDFTEILTEPNYADVDTLGAIACSGGQCEI